MAEDREIARVEAIANKALEVAQKAASDGKAHEDVCEQVRKLNEEHHRGNARFQEGMRAEFSKLAASLEDGLKLVREALNIQQRDSTERITATVSDLSERQSNTAASIITSVNQTVMGMKDLLTEMVKNATKSADNTNAALAAFIHSQTEMNKLLASNAKGASEDADKAFGQADKALDRNWQLGAAVLAMAVTGVIGVSAAYGKSKGWW